MLPAAALLTVLLFAVLTLTAVTTRADISFLRGVLVFGGLLALGLILASLLFGFTLGVVFAAAMVGLAAAILYSTSNVMLHYRTDQYVAASLSLFAAVALLFYYVLVILVSLRR